MDIEFRGCLVRFTEMPDFASRLLHYETLWLYKGHNECFGWTQ